MTLTLPVLKPRRARNCRKGQECASSEDVGSCLQRSSWYCCNILAWLECVRFYEILNLIFLQDNPLGKLSLKGASYIIHEPIFIEKHKALFCHWCKDKEPRHWARNLHIIMTQALYNYFKMLCPEDYVVLCLQHNGWSEFTSILISPGFCKWS